MNQFSARFAQKRLLRARIAKADPDFWVMWSNRSLFINGKSPAVTLIGFVDG